MRYQAPAREQVLPAVFARQPLAGFVADYGDWLTGEAWPPIEHLQARLTARTAGVYGFARQDRALLADGLHYESRIAQRGLIATRPENWHDLFNALIWLRYPTLKQALNRRQVGEIAAMGPKQRSRVQCALTHFDEAGALVAVADADLLAAWDRHDWDALFWRQRTAWEDGRLRLEVFGHALLEHALSDGSLLVAKVLAFKNEDMDGHASLVAAATEAIASGRALGDPQELRPLPLSGIPGWHPDNGRLKFYREAGCFRPLRPGRRYPPPLSMSAAPAGGEPPCELFC